MARNADLGEPSEPAKGNEMSEDTAQDEIAGLRILDTMNETCKPILIAAISCANPGAAGGFLRYESHRELIASIAKACDGMPDRRTEGFDIMAQIVRAACRRCLEILNATETTP